MRQIPALLLLCFAAPLAAQPSPGTDGAVGITTEAVAPGDNVGSTETAGVAAPDSGEGARTGVAATASPAPEPAAPRLAAPFPNPVRGAGSFRFMLPEPAEVRLALYDALGREVAVIAEGAEDAGFHVAPFDASRLAPGVYVARLTAGAQESVQRVTVRG